MRGLAQILKTPFLFPAHRLMDQGGRIRLQAGDELTEQYPRGICCHEAGHAIVASWFNLQVEAIYVRFEEKKGWYGRTITASPRHLPIPDQIANWVAGKAAQEFFGCPAPEGSCLGDFGEISSLFNRSGISLEELWPRIDEGSYWPPLFYKRSTTRLST